MPSPSELFQSAAPAPFDLNQPFPPAGDQPKAIDKLTNGFLSGKTAQVLLGATGTGKTYTMAKVIEATVEHFVFEITGRSAKIEQFIGIMAPLGLVEVCRTGVAALGRGADSMVGA